MGSLIFEKASELAVRTVPFSEGREVQRDFIENLRATFGRDKVYAEYRRGNYVCTFETHLLGAERDVSCLKCSMIVNLEMPGRIKRVNQPAK
jgi:hypothetical protein